MTPHDAHVKQRLQQLARQLSAKHVTDPARPDGITPPQRDYLVGLIERHGIETYRAVKAELDIPYAKSITRLSRSEAWRLINRLIEAPQ